jgi:hypothetical protein
MHQRIALTLRLLARLTNQHTARANAAEGSATLRRRRLDQQQVDEYLQGRILVSTPADPQEEGRDEHGVEHTL